MDYRIHVAKWTREILFRRRRFTHVFDGSALIQKYKIEQGKVSYQCRFLQTRAFKKNSEANLIVQREFGTNPSERDGVKRNSLLQRLKGFIYQEELMSDNANITIYPLGENYYAFYESPYLTCVDADTLETVGKVDLTKTLGKVMHHASHPQFDENGNMLTVGMRVGFKGPEYIVSYTEPNQNQSSIKDKSTEEKKEIISKEFDTAKVVCQVPCQWALNPCYMHSFSITENYAILIEQPLSISTIQMGIGLIKGDPMGDCLKWHTSVPTLFHVINRKTGERLPLKFKADPFFYFHTINAYEDDDHIVVDICCFEGGNGFGKWTVDLVANAQGQHDFSSMFKGKPQRFVLPINKTKINEAQDKTKLNSLSYTTSQAELKSNGEILITPQIICELPCEMPSIYFAKYNMKKYRYFYSISVGEDDPVCPKYIRKVDVLSGEVTSWSNDDTYVSEPMFVPNPNGSGEEDDGVVLTTLIKKKPDVKYGALLVLDAKTLKEIGRAEFDLIDTPVSKPLHSYFTGNNIAVNKGNNK